MKVLRKQGLIMLVLIIILSMQVYGWVSDGIPWKPAPEDMPSKTYYLEDMEVRQETVSVENKSLESVVIQKPIEEIVDVKKINLYFYIIGFGLLFVILIYILVKGKRRTNKIVSQDIDKEYNESLELLNKIE